MMQTYIKVITMKRVEQMHSQRVATSIYSIHKDGLYYIGLQKFHNSRCASGTDETCLSKTKGAVRTLFTHHGLHPVLQATKLLASPPYPLKRSKSQPILRSYYNPSSNHRPLQTSARPHRGSPRVWVAPKTIACEPGARGWHSTPPSRSAQHPAS
jgi:hypothetical protein